MLHNQILISFLIIIIGIIGSSIGSLIGSGSGLVTIFLIILVIGTQHSEEAKIISLSAVAVLSLFGILRYIKLKEPPHWIATFWICIGYLPLSVIGIIVISPYLESDNIQNYFPYFYVLLVVILLLLINFKSKIKTKKVLPYWSLPLVGGVVGILVGTFGVGLLTMTILVVGLKIPLRKATSSFLVIAFAYAIVDMIAAAFSGQYSSFSAKGVLWYLPLVIIIGSIIGSQIGPLINNRISDKTMAILFNSILSLIAIYEIIHGSLLIAGIHPL